MEPSALIETVEDGKSKQRLGALVAITVALLATFMGICKVKDDNICQAMQQAQADKIDDWGWYQAKKTRIEMMQQSRIQVLLVTPQTDASKKLITGLEKQIKDKSGELDDQKKKADADQKTYDTMNFRDDQFDLADSSSAIAIALLAMSALTEKKWLYLVALVPTAFGLIMGLAGLLGLGIHPDFLAKLLGT